MKKIRVMIVEDSAVVRELLQFIVGSDPRFEVAAAVESAEEALAVLNRVSPDVISMDIRLPGMNGFDATKRIMSLRPTPIVVIAGTVAGDELKIGINALRAGALAVVEKPVGVSHCDYLAHADTICTQLAIMSQVKVVRRRFDSIPDMKAPAAITRPAAVSPIPRVAPSSNGRHSILGIVASTGGPNAVLQVLTGLGRQFPIPILLIQHITACFLDGFVSWLSGACPLEVVIARNNEVPVPGKVYVPSADRHLRFDAGALRLDASEPVSFQRPSGTVLFESMAQSLGPRGIGVLLTGMGDDGAEGLLALRNAGGYTLAEDESTAVVYGMPAEAARRNAVCEALPLPEIAPAILDRVCG